MWSIWDYVVDKFKSENTDKVRKKINKTFLSTACCRNVMNRKDFYAQGHYSLFVDVEIKFVNIDMFWYLYWFTLSWELATIFLGQGETLCTYL